MKDAADSKIHSKKHNQQVDGAKSVQNTDSSQIASNPIWTEDTISSTHEAKASWCACFGELGLNDEAKASRFEPNFSLSNKKRDQMYGLFLFFCRPSNGKQNISEKRRAQYGQISI